MSGVKLEHVNHVLGVNEGVVNGSNLNTLEDGSPENQSPNSSETVDSNLDHLLGVK